MAKPTEKQILAMKKLGMTDEEIADVITCDEAIDKGQKVPFDLDAEKEKEAKKYIRTGTKKPTVYQLDNTGGKRTRKENTTKSAIIAELVEFLSKNAGISAEKVEILNKERQIAFKIGEDAFELTLTQKRKPKK